jgi:serine/threonine protein kinase
MRSAEALQAAPSNLTNAVLIDRQALFLFRELMDYTLDEQERKIADAGPHDPLILSRVRQMLARHHDQTCQQLDELTQQIFQPLPSELGPFRIAGMLGEGGMGRVARGVRTMEHGVQQVAIKMVYAPPNQHVLRERFFRERELLARLQHPAIAALIDFSQTPGGLLWYAMELIDGVSIESYCKNAALGAPKIVALIIELCDVLQYAHSLGVIHRDIKPQNVLVSAEGKLHLIDFGIAKSLDDDAELSRHGNTPMTPRYASPEQLAHKSVTTATDQWQVAILSYELLCEQRYERVSSTALHLPTARAGLSADLRAVLSKALRPEPKERYTSIAEFASDLRHALQGRPVQARMGERYYALRKFVSGHRWILVSSAMVAVTLVAATWHSHSLARRANEQARIAQRSNALLSEIFLSDEQGPNLPQLSLGGFIANGVKLAMADQELPANVKRKLLDELAERASEAGEHAAAQIGEREVLRLARAQTPVDPLEVAQACASLALMLLNSPGREDLDDEIQALIREAGTATPAPQSPHTTAQAKLAVLVARARAFYAAYQQDFAVAQTNAEHASELADRWLRDDPWAVINAHRTRAVMLSAAHHSTDAVKVYQEIVNYADAQLTQYPKLANTTQWDRAQLCAELSASDPTAAKALCMQNIEQLQKAGRMESMLAVENLSGLGRSLARRNTNKLSAFLLC